MIKLYEAVTDSYPDADKWIPPFHVKIGISTNPAKRIKQWASGCPFPIQGFWTIPLNEVFSIARRLEHSIHSVLSSYKTKNEWFIYDDYDTYQSMRIVMLSILAAHHQLHFNEMEKKCKWNDGPNWRESKKG
jgi:hypothetical protein